MAKILLVEDDLDLAMIVTDSLTAQEHTVEHAATGPAARERLVSSSYDLVVLDWDLPGATGYDILKEYRGRGGACAVMMLSGRSSFDEKEAALDAGADDYLTKPFALKELRARVRSLLRRTTDSRMVQQPSDLAAGAAVPAYSTPSTPPFNQPPAPAHSGQHGLPFNQPPAPAHSGQHGLPFNQPAAPAHPGQHGLPFDQPAAPAHSGQFNQPRVGANPGQQQPYTRDSAPPANQPSLSSSGPHTLPPGNTAQAPATPTFSPPASAIDSQPGSLPPHMVSQSVAKGSTLEGKYLLEEQIGQGETAVVWRATHTIMNRTVVVKILAAHLVDNSQASSRFLQECQAMARLNHPNIISVFEVGRADKTPYVVMEHLKGETIRDIIEKHGAAPTRVAMEIMVQICRGLQVAHNAGIIHRDLKPGNIIIQNQADRQNMIVKIVDFGISFLSGSVERITQDGTVVGTLGYIAPEQLQDVAIDFRADLYALGVIFYEMLSGRLPFESKTPHALLIKKVMENPEPIWTRRADIPAGSPVDMILQRALQKDRDQRYQSAEQLRSDIERVLNQRS